MSTRNSESEDLLAQNGNRLHEVMMRMVFLYSVFYTIYNYYRGYYDQLIFVATPMPAVVVSYWLYRSGRSVFSKVLLIVVTMVIVINICNIESQETFILAFFGPIIVGSLVTLQGPNRRIGYGMAVISCVTLIYLLLTDFGPNAPLSFSRQGLQVERIMNLVGSSILIAAQLMFIMRNSRLVQEQLILRSQDLHKSNEELRQTIATRDKLLSVLSHDLRTPLMLLSSGFDLLRSGNLEEPVKETLMLQLRARTRLTSALVDNLVIWSKNQADAIRYRPAAISLSVIRQQVSDCISLMDPTKKVRLENEVPNEGTVTADRDLLDTVLRNLLSNAFKFTPHDGTIVVSAHQDTGEWVLSVKDNGCGMSAEAVRKILDQESFSTLGTEKEKGHGIGLRLVNDFLSKHGSKLDVNSEVGLGTTFSFRLKAA
jgi:signal transduction histidine kinase